MVYEPACNLERNSLIFFEKFAVFPTVSLLQKGVKENPPKFCSIAVFAFRELIFNFTVLIWMVERRRIWQ